MKRLLLTFIAVIAIYTVSLAKDIQNYYQLKIYHYNSSEQEKRLDLYLEKAYLPALHKAGFTQIGVFKQKEAKEEGKKLFVFIPFSDFNKFLNIENVLIKDAVFQKAGEDYLLAKHNNSPYTRIESILMKAFKASPKVVMPKLSSPKADRVYELRSYEAATENLSINKIDMFNDAEIAIFDKLNFNAVFYGQVISGSTMPNMMYLTTFNNQEDRDKHWKDFGPAYKPLSEKPQYQNNVSKNIREFLYPTDYSDI